jgi:hypothetical protein
MLPLQVDDFVNLAHAGAGFCLDASRLGLEDLVRVCHAAADHRAARIVVENAGALSADDLLQLAYAAKGLVTFEE